MNYAPLPSLLKVGDKICQRKYAPDEVLEVFKVDAETGRVYLMRENDVALRNSQNVELLRAYDYMIISEQ
jgi:hypothetical protein